MITQNYLKLLNQMTQKKSGKEMYVVCVVTNSNNPDKALRLCIKCNLVIGML